MTRRGFVVLVCSIALGVAALRAQENTATTDPITGTWTGELRPKDGPPPAAVTFELKYDGKNKVTGSFTGLTDPGEVKNGTYDAKTDAIKLDLGKLDGPAVLIVLEGKVIKGEVSGTMTAGPNTGTFTLARKKTE